MHQQKKASWISCSLRGLSKSSKHQPHGEESTKTLGHILCIHLGLSFPSGKWRFIGIPYQKGDHSWKVGQPNACTSSLTKENGRFLSKHSGHYPKMPKPFHGFATPTNHSGKLTLDIQTHPEKVFGPPKHSLNIFSGGIWMPRATGNPNNWWCWVDVWGICRCYCWWRFNPAPVEVGSFSNYL